MSRSTFVSPALDAVFDDLGYAVVPGLAAPAQVAELRALYQRVHPTDADAPERSPAAPGAEPIDWESQGWPGQRFLTGVDEIDDRRRAELERAAAPLWESMLPQVLDDHVVVLTSFLMKFPGPDGVMPIHQDPTMVDEREHRSCTVWLTLDDTDTTLDNGPLYVVPRSHRLSSELRGSGTTPSYIDDMEAAWEVAQPIGLRAGDALVVDSRLLHGSPPNRSKAARLAVGVVCAPREATRVHVIGEAGGTARLVSVDDDFYQRRSPRAIRASPPLDAPELAVLPAVTRPFDATAVAAPRTKPRSLRDRLVAVRRRST